MTNLDTLQLIYTSKAGASIIRGLPRDENAVAKAMAALARRHIEARLMCDKFEIGFVFQQSGRWVWYFDPHYVRESYL